MKIKSFDICYLYTNCLFFHKLSPPGIYKIKSYDIFYFSLAFDRLSKLTEFNMLLHVEDIKKAIAEVVAKKRANPAKQPCTVDEVKKLGRVSTTNRSKLTRYLSNLETKRSLLVGLTDESKPKASSVGDESVGSSV